MSKKEAGQLLQNSFDFKILSSLRPDSLLWIELQNFKKDTLLLESFLQVESHKVFDTKRNISYRLIVFRSSDRLFLFLTADSVAGAVVLGYREAEIKNTGDSYSSDGSIHILAQGYGLSTVIEHFFEKFMNQWSRVVGCPISHTVEDENIKDLQKLETAFELAQTAQDFETALELASLLKDKRVERDAWQRLYGSKGKFGTELINGKLIRVFDGYNKKIMVDHIAVAHKDKEVYKIADLLNSIVTPY